VDQASHESSRKLVLVALSDLVARASTPVARYPFRVHLRRYMRVVCQFHRPISRQFEPIKPLTGTTEHV
jgi:hypothetical protein